jgi:hypothetical protein
VPESNLGRGPVADAELGIRRPVTCRRTRLRTSPPSITVNNDQQPEGRISSVESKITIAYDYNTFETLQLALLVRWRQLLTEYARRCLNT